MTEMLKEWGLGPEAADLVLSYASRVIGVIVILVIAIVVSGWLKRLVVSRLTAVKFDATLTKFLGSLTRWAIMVFAILGCLGVFGVETTSFAAVIGGASLAIGLAFQGSLSNVAAGAMLLLFRPYKVGDVISVAGKTGKVDEIDLFTTALDTPDRRRIIVPNGQVFGQTIENITFHPTRRVDVAVGVDYSASIDETRKVLAGAVDGVENVLPDEPVVAVLTGLGESSVDWQVRVMTQTENYGQVMEDLTRSIKLALDEAGIGIPYPHRVVLSD